MKTRLLISIFLISIKNAVAEEPIVETSIGTIRGVKADDGTHQYMGIPYASVNESNPFGAAIPHPGFDSIFEANDDSSICPQIEEFNQTVVGDIDCLHLNVYTPASASATNSLPVFVWIYGGGFTIGFNGKFLYGPKFLTRHDVILVTINYRVGPYGFMCLDIPEVPGNQGLKDTLLALRWVQKHIQSFGGDPNKVTVGGNSAGGIVADFYLLREANDEVLFHNAIVQSGTAQMVDLQQNIPASYNYPIILASSLGYEADDVYTAIDFLATVPSHDLILASSNLSISTGACAEIQFEGIEPFLTKSVSTARYNVQNVSIIIGITDDETFAFANTNNPMVVDLVLGLAYDTEHENLTGADIVSNFYFIDQEIEDEIYRGSINLRSDFSFVYPTHRTMSKYLENNVKSLYFYKFAHDGGRNFVKYRENIVGGGAIHADEIGYLFDMKFIPEEPSPEDQLVIDKMTGMWANFIKYRDPTPVTTDLLDVKWTPVTKTSRNCMVIAEELSLVNRPFNERMAFLELFDEINGHLRRV